MSIRILTLTVIAELVAASSIWAQSPTRIGSINPAQTRTLAGNVHPLARATFDRGNAPADLPMDRMLLVLTRSAGQQSELDALLTAQQNPASPDYHRWLTPQQFGSRFGASDADVQTITNWLQAQGFVVNRVSNGRTVVEFSGTAGQVQQAFRTEIHRYVVNGEEHWANAGNPQIPAALASVVAGVATLHNFTKQTQLIRSAQTFEASLSSRGQPQFTSSSGTYALSPGDYATIYNLKPLFAAGINGAGRSIAVIGRTNIRLSDITDFRSTFGLPANSPKIILNGPDPGDLGGSEEAEAVLDTTWSGAAAPGATIDLVVSKTTNTSDGVDLSEEYIIDNNLADVMTESFGDCEANYTQAEANMYSSLAQQAAAQGITYFVAAGDSGSAGCNSGSDNTSNGALSVNILASNPYVVAVGGTEFNENGNYSAYWSSTTSSTGISVLSYIPENVWNESCTVSTGTNPCTSGNSPGLWAGGGGSSVLYAKPAWQTGVAGIPNDGARDVPDVALTAAGHDPYLLCLGGSCTPNQRGRISFFGYSGTSAATPSMAGILATILQEIGGRAGAINSSLYQLAATESLAACNASNTGAFPAGACVFNDVTVGSNSVPGEAKYNPLTGATYQAGVGYDLATGLGSVNAANLAQALAGVGFGAGTLSVSTDILGFGSVNLGMPAVQQLTLSNTGNGNLLVSQLSIGGASNEYSATLNCSKVILPGENCTVTVAFTPTYSGLQSANLTITTNGSAATIALWGTGVATSYATLSTTSVLNFGNQKVVTRSQPQAVTLTNSTMQALDTSTIVIGGVDPEDFSTGNTCGATLASGTSCTLYVIFTPMLAGSRSAVLTVPVGAGSATSTISLSGTGTLNGLFEIVNMLTGKVLEVPGGATANGTAIQQNALNGYEQQQWQLVPTGDGYYEIQNALTGKALDVTNASVNSGARIQQWDYHGYTQQQWQLAPIDDVHYAIISRNSGMALDVVNGATANGTPIQQWSYLGDRQQLWVMVPAGSYNITNTLSSYVLDVTSGSTANGALIQQWVSNGFRQQQWQFVPVGGGYYAIMNRNSGKVLDVTSASLNSGALIQQWDYNGYAQQQWQLFSSDGLNYRIENRLSGDILDDTNASMAPGTDIQQWASLGNKNQQWQLTPVVYYNILNKNSGLVLDVVNGSTADGTAIQQWPSNGLAQEQWQLVTVTNGYYAFMNNLTGKVLDVSSNANAAPILQNSYAGSSTQQWQIIPLSGGYFEIQNGASGKALDITNASTDPGALLQQWNYLGFNQQQWQLTPVGNQF